MPDIITIGREYGSGGSKIAKELAAALQIPFFDKKLIEIAAKETGLSEEFIQEASNAAPRASYITSPSAAGICRYLIRFLSRKLM